MKPTFIKMSACLLLLANTASAQSLSLNKDQERQYVIQTLLSRQMQRNTMAAKSTGLKERLIGQSTYQVQPTSSLIDTAAYRYSGSHSSTFDFNYMQYTQLYTQQSLIQLYFPLINLVIDSHYPAIQPLITADTTLNSFGVPSPHTPGRLSLNTYNSDNEITSENEIITSTPYAGQFYQYNYNASNQLISFIAYDDTLGSAPTDTTGKTYLSYNTSGQLVQDSVFVCAPGISDLTGKYTYEYDASGNLIKVNCYYYSAPSFILYRSYVLTYNSSNQITSVQMNNASGTPFSKDVFNYASGVDYFISDSTFYITGSVSTLHSAITKHINTAGLPDTVINIKNVPDDEYIDIFTYDSYNNPITQYDSLTRSIHDSSSSPVYYVKLSHFYYETYSPTGIQNVAQQSDNTVIYPNPANNNITIKTDKNEPVRIMVINSLGQKVITTSTLTATNEHTIPLANIQPGIYWIFVYNNNNKLLHSQSFVKQ